MTLAQIEALFFARIQGERKRARGERRKGTAADLRALAVATGG